MAARQCLQRNKENLRLAKMTRIAKLLHLPLPDPTSDSLHPPLGLDQPDIGSFIAVSPPELLSSPLTDLTRSGLHHALQNPPLVEGSTLQDIEMAQLQSSTLEGVVTSKEMSEIPSSEPTQSNPSGQSEASPDTPMTGVSEVEEEGFPGHWTPLSVSAYTSTNST